MKPSEIFETPEASGFARVGKTFVGVAQDDDGVDELSPCPHCHSMTKITMTGQCGKCEGYKAKVKNHWNEGDRKIQGSGKADSCDIVFHAKSDMTDEKKYTQWDMDNEYARGCNDGAYEQRELSENPSFYRTIMDSPQWQAWVKYNEETPQYDVHESMECGWLSQNHWQAFIKWAKEN